MNHQSIDFLVNAFCAVRQRTIGLSCAVFLPALAAMGEHCFVVAQNSHLCCAFARRHQAHRRRGPRHFESLSRHRGNRLGRRVIFLTPSLQLRRHDARRASVKEHCWHAGWPASRPWQAMRHFVSPAISRDAMTPAVVSGRAHAIEHADGRRNNHRRRSFLTDAAAICFRQRLHAAADDRHASAVINTSRLLWLYSSIFS